MRRKIAFVLTAALAAAPALLAQKQAPPAAGKPKGFSVPAPKTFQLDNGLSVTLVPYGAVPKVTVRLGVLTGNGDEKANEVWLADLMGDLLSEGTKTRTATQIAEDAAKMGGSLDVVVGENRTDIGGDVLAEFAPQMIALVADVARNPSLPDSELARKKTDRARQLSIAKSQPQPLAQEKLRAVLYGDSPYGRLFPTEAMLTGLHDRPGPRLLRAQLRRGPVPPLRRGPLRRRRRGGRGPEGLLRLEAGARRGAPVVDCQDASAPSISWTGPARRSPPSTSPSPSSTPPSRTGTGCF